MNGILHGPAPPATSYATTSSGLITATLYTPIDLTDGGRLQDGGH